jgi:hypothetical protein
MRTGFPVMKILASNEASYLSRLWLDNMENYVLVRIQVKNQIHFLIYLFVDFKFKAILHKCSFLFYIHKQVCSKLPIFYFNGPKCPLDNCYVT